MGQAHLFPRQMFSAACKYTKVFKPLSILLAIVIMLSVTTCTKKESQQSEPPNFKNITFNYKSDFSRLVQIAKIEANGIEFTVPEKAICDAIERDENYTYCFDENSVFEFDFSSLSFFYENLDYIYLKIEGLVYTDIGNSSKRIVIYYLMAPDDQGNVYNTYTNIDVCVSTGCSHCHADRELGIVVGCTCTSHDGECEHNIVTKTRGEYFILPMN